MWKDIWVDLQEPEAILTVSQVLAHKVLPPLGTQEADALAQVVGNQQVSTQSSLSA